MAAPLISNEHQLEYALIQFYHDRDELDRQIRNYVPLGRLDHAKYSDDKSELRVLLRNRCLRSTVAASTTGKTELLRNLWEAFYQLNVQRFEEEVLYIRHNSRPRGLSVADWLEYHAGIDVTIPQSAQIVAHLESPTMVRAVPLLDPFEATTHDYPARQPVRGLPLAVKTPPPLPLPPTTAGVRGLHFTLPPSATRNPQDQPNQNRHVSPGPDLLAEANQGPPAYAILPPVRPLTPRWFVRVRDRLRYGRQEHHGTVDLQAVLERLRRQAGQPRPVPEEQQPEVQSQQEPVRRSRQQTQQRPNRPPVIDLIREGERPLRRFLDWSHWLCFWMMCGPILCLVAFIVSATIWVWTDLYYDKWLHEHGSCMYVFSPY